MHVKKIFLVTIVLLALPANFATAQASQDHLTPAGKPAAPANPITPFAWLVGGVWTADASKIAPGMLRIETQYTWSDNRRFLRFTTHFVSSSGTLNNYDGNLYWDPAEKSFHIWYQSASGEVTSAPVTLDGDRWQMDFAGTDFDDAPAQLRVVVDRKSPDLYHWSLSKQSGSTQQPLLGLDYARK